MVYRKRNSEVRKTMKYLLLIFLIGCDVDSHQDISKFTCDSLEMNRVQSETNFCKNNAGFIGSYCYYASMKRICKENVK